MKQSTLRTLVQTAGARRLRVYILSLAFIAISTLFTGCASIVDGRVKTVNIISNPPGARVTIYDRSGRLVSANTTPANVPLDTGRFFRPAGYRLSFDMPGFRPFETDIRARINPWYFGNFVFLPLSPVGFLIDPATGAMWTLRPTTISRSLRP